MHCWCCVREASWYVYVVDEPWVTRMELFGDVDQGADQGWITGIYWFQAFVNPVETWGNRK